MRGESGKKRYIRKGKKKRNRTKAKRKRSRGGNLVKDIQGRERTRYGVPDTVARGMVNGAPLPEVW